jgi:hypothetical protein
LHRILRIAGADPLVLGLHASEQLHDQSFSAELVAEKRSAIARIAVEGRAEIGTGAEQSALIVVAAERADRAETPARLVESLAEGVARAQIAGCGVVARLDPGEDFAVRILGRGRSKRRQ